MSLQDGLHLFNQDKHDHQTKSRFKELVQEEQYIGDLYAINYETAKIIIHDFQKNQVGGVPSLSFLIATRVNPKDTEKIDFQTEDTSIILLRVMDAAQLPQDREFERVRTEVAQRVSGETNKNWDAAGIMDAKTRNLLSFAAVECRIIGTFYLDLPNLSQADGDLILKFGSDISNYYPNKGMKVYKPNSEALEKIVNFIDASILSDYKQKYGTASRVKLGRIRYASTDRNHQKVTDVAVSIFPADLLSQKSALFGMTRTGKSNTVKIIAKSVYELRHPKNTGDQPLRIGQIIFDPNGEYANENVQDNNTALKNIWKLIPNAAQATEVTTYGLDVHPNDPERKLMKINFFDERLLQTGKEIINATLAEESAQYFRNFVQVRFEKPEKETFEVENEYWVELRRYLRRKLVYLTLLKKAGFEPPKLTVPIKWNKMKLFSDELCQAMKLHEDRKDKKKEGLIKSAATVFSMEEVSYDVLVSAFEGLFWFLSTDVYNHFNTQYAEKHVGASWADSDLERLLEMFAYPKGTNLIGKLAIQHSTALNEDYAKVIYDDLKQGKLVVIDQSSGTYEFNKFTAQRIVERIFFRNQNLFRKGATAIPEILIYIEEAHNILPADNEKNMRDIWVRTAKEGAKYRIGMVYSTQEVSSIQKNILKNTSNWFIGHLNNTDETKELCKYYDFADFEKSILRTQDKGFLRVKTMSNYFVIPVQVKKFDVTDKF